MVGTMAIQGSVPTSTTHPHQASLQAAPMLDVGPKEDEALPAPLNEDIRQAMEDAETVKRAMDQAQIKRKTLAEDRLKQLKKQILALQMIAKLLDPRTAATQAAFLARQLTDTVTQYADNRTPPENATLPGSEATIDTASLAEDPKVLQATWQKFVEDSKQVSAYKMTNDEFCYAVRTLRNQLELVFGQQRRRLENPGEVDPELKKFAGDIASVEGALKKMKTADLSVFGTSAASGLMVDQRA